jgi:hypothetical protein
LLRVLVSKNIYQGFFLELLFVDSVALNELRLHL